MKQPTLLRFVLFCHLCLFTKWCMEKREHNLLIYHILLVTLRQADYRRPFIIGQCEKLLIYQRPG